MESDLGTDYRAGTRHLIIHGLGREGNQFNEIERRLISHNITVHRIHHVVDYQELPSIAKARLGNPGVYLVMVDDMFGSRAMDLAHGIQPFLGDFDTVDGIYWLGGESSGGRGVQRIKHNGAYANFYSPPPQG
ncbi:MAG: hypothetical protein HY518_04000 [Candidatus Aenigmarchaeota archaeon]|nr:hypothetical protein [Candidatus Aenigmarchaeota archaeon]